MEETLDYLKEIRMKLVKPGTDPYWMYVFDFNSFSEEFDSPDYTMTMWFNPTKINTLDFAKTEIYRYDSGECVFNGYVRNTNDLKYVFPLIFGELEQFNISKL